MTSFKWYLKINHKLIVKFCMWKTSFYREITLTCCIRIRCANTLRYQPPFWCLGFQLAPRRRSTRWTPPPSWSCCSCDWSPHWQSSAVAPQSHCKTQTTSPLDWMKSHKSYCQWGLLGARGRERVARKLSSDFCRKGSLWCPPARLGCLSAPTSYSCSDWSWPALAHPLHPVVTKSRSMSISQHERVSNGKGFYKSSRLTMKTGAL